MSSSESGRFEAMISAINKDQAELTRVSQEREDQGDIKVVTMRPCHDIETLRLGTRQPYFCVEARQLP